LKEKGTKMLRVCLLASALVLLSACGGLFKNRAQLRKEIAQKTAPEVGCSADALKISDEVKLFAYGHSSWLATGCGQDFRCVERVKGITTKRACRKSSAKDEELRREAIKRAKLECGSRGAIVWDESYSSAEVAVRLSTCGKFYLCTASSSGAGCKVVPEPAAGPRPPGSW